MNATNEWDSLIKAEYKTLLMQVGNLSLLSDETIAKVIAFKLIGVVSSKKKYTAITKRILELLKEIRSETI
jgi:hypothetical protein